MKVCHREICGRQPSRHLGGGSVYQNLIVRDFNKGRGSEKVYDMRFADNKQVHGSAHQAAICPESRSVRNAIDCLKIRSQTTGYLGRAQNIAARDVYMHHWRRIEIDVALWVDV